MSTSKRMRARLAAVLVVVIAAGGFAHDSLVAGDLPTESGSGSGIGSGPGKIKKRKVPVEPVSKVERPGERPQENRRP